MNPFDLKINVQVKRVHEVPEDLPLTDTIELDGQKVGGLYGPRWLEGKGNVLGTYVGEMYLDPTVFPPE